MDFDTFDEFKIILSEVFTDVWENEVSDMSIRKFKNAKQVKVYNAYQPLYYDRTYDFLNSNMTRMNKPRSNSISLTVFTDTRNKSMPSKHPSLVTGQNMNKAIPYFTEFGNNSSFANYAGRPYIDFAIQLIETVLKTTTIKGLKRLGIDAY